MTGGSYLYLLLYFSLFLQTPFISWIHIPTIRSSQIPIPIVHCPWSRAEFSQSVNHSTMWSNILSAPFWGLPVCFFLFFCCLCFYYFVGGIKGHIAQGPGQEARRTEHKKRTRGARRVTISLTWDMGSAKALVALERRTGSGVAVAMASSSTSLSPSASGFLLLFFGWFSMGGASGGWDGWFSGSSGSLRGSCWAALWLKCWLVVAACVALRC